MKRPIAFQMLAALSKQEIQQLEQYLKSPVYNKRPEMPRLLNWWKVNRHGRMDKQAIYEAVVPEKKYLSRDWYLLLSRFTSLVESFLVWQEMKKEALGHHSFLLAQLRRRKQAGLFNHFMNQAKVLLSKWKQYTTRHLFHAYELEQHHYDYVASHDRQSRTNLQEMSDRLDELFIAEKLKLACLEHSRYITNQESYQVYFLHAIEQHLKQYPLLLEVPAIQVYHACYEAVVKGGDKRAFHHLRQAIKAHQHGFTKKDIRDIYLLAINYCIRALNRGEEDFAKAAFSLYKQSLEEGYLLEDGYIPESTFSNIVSLGLKLRLFEEVERFIHEQKQHLRPAFQLALPSYTAAKLAYEQGRYAKVLQLLASVEARQPFLYLGIKTLQLKAFYELEEWDALDSLLESLRVYLQRHKKLGYHREHYVLLLQFTRRLLQLSPVDREGSDALRADVIAAKAFREREWILQYL